MKYILLSCTIHGMLNAAMISPKDIIEKRIEKPRMLPLELDFIPKEKLITFRDEHRNNLMHIAILALHQKQDAADFDRLLEESKFLFSYLKSIGININEENKHGKTPVFLAYDNPKTDQFAEDFLTHPTMGGHQTKAPSLSVKKILAKIFPCTKKHT